MINNKENMKKNYSSLDQINNDLKILRLEKEIAYQKLHLAVDSLKEELTPDNLIRNSISSASSFVSNTSGNIKALAISSILKFLVNRWYK